MCGEAGQVVEILVFVCGERVLSCLVEGDSLAQVSNNDGMLLYKIYNSLSLNYN